MSKIDKRLYPAMVWRNRPNKPGERVSVLARDIDEARRLLEETHGKGNVFYLHNPNDAR